MEAWRSGELGRDDGSSVQLWRDISKLTVGLCVMLTAASKEYLAEDELQRWTTTMLLSLQRFISAVPLRARPPVTAAGRCCWAALRPGVIV